MGTTPIEQVHKPAEFVGPRWRALILLAAFTALRPEESAELRRPDIDRVAGTVRVRMAAPEPTTGRRVVDDPTSDAGRRTVAIPAVILPADQRKSLSAAHPLGRIAQASEIADTVVRLSSDKSSFVTGITLSVDGGYSVP